MGRCSDDRSSAARRDPHLVKIPEQIYERVRALCLALPEVTVRVDEPPISGQLPAWSYDRRISSPRRVASGHDYFPRRRGEPADDCSRPGACAKRKPRAQTRSATKARQSGAYLSSVTTPPRRRNSRLVA